MELRTSLQRFRHLLNKFFGIRLSDAHTDLDLHSAQTVLAPSPPVGIRRVQPRRSKAAALPPSSADAMDTEAPPLVSASPTDTQDQPESEAAQPAPKHQPTRAPGAPLETRNEQSIAARARENIGILLARDKPTQALLVLSNSLRLDKQFQPAAETVLPLAREAFASNQAMLAMRVMQRFDVLHPGHPDTAAVIALSARIMTQLGRTDGAWSLIQAFHTYFPAHVLAHEVDLLAQQLASMQAQAGASVHASARPA